MQLQLGLVLRLVLLGLLQLQGEAGRRLAVAGAEVGLHLGLELRDVLTVQRRLPADPLDQGPVLFQPLAALLQLGDRLVVLILHLGNRIGRPEYIGDLIDLRHQRVPELPHDHRRTSL